ncbi:MAG: endolytic transglycosylase MltG [Bacillota bacterium]|nr:endolytic transglycosylase MltG [Eubacteriales bacterium]MDD4286640.1 endolytic transglycosylase MltG [Eubacteriales bacterium]MDI9491369.1 endolytic transglycosylase MltG [Bacillota bacterium]NLV70215.1 endolytic transglycosylase MltG [Clostridiales bacterium]
MTYRRKKRNHKKTQWPIVMLLIIAAGAAASFAYIKGYDKAADPADTEIVAFTVTPGMSTTSIASSLEAEGLIDSSFVFKQKSKMDGYDGRYQAGTFHLSPSMTLEEIMDRLMDARKETARFTIPEGYTIRQTAAALAGQGLVDEQEFLSILNEERFDYRFLSEAGEGPDRLEGFLFPDTYEVFVDASAREILVKMLDRFDEIFLPEYYDRAEEMDLSIRELITIASLVEEETRAPEERKRVAGVVYNRLAIGMKLGFDSTIQYLLGEPKERVLYADLEIDSPYNTYMYAGLPPGPISSPGKECILAALYPEETDYLYFVLKEYGSVEHHFAVTAEEFYRYKDAYIKTLP